MSNLNPLSKPHPSTIAGPAHGGLDLTSITGTSGPVDTTTPYSQSSLAGKTILLTGGASGFGASFARRWAGAGAHLIIADINDAAGLELVAELRSLPGSSGQHFFFHCDVTVWEDQVRLFREAVKASPTGGIDAVVPNAGIPERNSAVTELGLENPVDLDSEDAEPKAPELDVLRTNLVGVVYSVHLALYWLPRNRDPKYVKPGMETGRKRDRHILLIGSVAGIMPLPGQPEYTVAKHGVTGLFRALAGSGFRHGVRTNLVMPYFADTPLVPWQGMMFLAGGGLASVEDVVDAATRFMADESIVGRGLVVTPRVDVVKGEEDGEPRLAGGKREMGKSTSTAVWEVYAHDYEHVEIFVYRYVRLMNAILKVRGWVGVVKDFVSVYFFRRRREMKR